MDVKEDDILGDDIAGHWYYVSKGRAMRRFLGEIRVREVLDIGAGSGIFSRQLLDHNVCDSAVCVDPAYPNETNELHHGRPIRFVKSLDCVDQHLILMMDVLEHVEDDFGLLRTYTDPMPVDGHVLITVPAFQFLWSGHDVFLEHHRRYTLQQVELLLRRAGLEAIRRRYFFGSLFPVIAAIRWYQRGRLADGLEARSDLRKMSRPINKALIWVHDMERRVIFPWNRFAGLSVFCLAKKV